MNGSIYLTHWFIWIFLQYLQKILNLNDTQCNRIFMSAEHVLLYPVWYRNREINVKILHQRSPKSSPAPETYLWEGWVGLFNNIMHHRTSCTKDHRCTHLHYSRVSDRWSTLLFEKKDVPNPSDLHLLFLHHTMPDILL